MSGFVNGSMEVDWAQVMNAARAMYRRPEPAQPSAPQPVEPAKQPEPVGGLPEAPDGEVGQQAPEPEENMSAEARKPPEAQESEFPEAQGQTEVQNSELEEAQGPTEVPKPSAAEEEGQRPAADLLALDISVPWPEPAEPLRALFQQLPACTPFPADGYTFVSAPLPGNGKAHSLVGVRVEDEKPTTVCYGIPGIFAPEPPAGLDGYMWRGSGVNGWWVIFVDALTGEEVPE